MKQKICIILVIVLSFFCGVGTNKYYSSKEKAVNMEYTIDTLKKEKSTKVEYNIDTFKSVATKIEKSFHVDGYENILINSGDTVVVPDSVAGRQDIPSEGLYSREKHFIYKNSKNSVVILMSVTANKNISTEREWQHSIGYDSKIHNSKTNRYKKYYNDKFPNSDVYLYSFAGQGYNISIVGISENPNNEDVYTVSELANFTNKLSIFFEEQNIK